MLSNPRFEPMGDRILVLKDPEEKVSSGGIHIPDTVHDKKFTGTVLAVGTGRIEEKDGEYKKFPVELRVQDRVIFTHYVGHPIKIDGAEYMLLRENDILGVLDE